MKYKKNDHKSSTGTVRRFVYQKTRYVSRVKSKYVMVTNKTAASKFYCQTFIYNIYA